MATTAQNNLYRRIDDVMNFPVSTGTVINEGDIVYFSGSSDNKIHPIDDGSDAVISGIVGIALGTNPVTYHGSLTSLPVFTGKAIVSLICNEVASINLFTPVYFDTDAQHFIVSGSGTPIGYAFPDAKELNGTTAVTTASGSRYPIVLRKSKAHTFIDSSGYTI